MASRKFRKHWKTDGTTDSIEVVPEEFKTFHTRPPGAIEDVLRAYGFAGLVACPDTLLDGDPVPPSSQRGSPDTTEIVRIPGSDEELWTPPPELLTQEIPAHVSAFTIPLSTIRDAAGWGETQMTASHHPIYDACICGLAEMVGREAKAELNPRTKDGLETDIRFVLFPIVDGNTREATFCSEHKRPDSAYQATFEKEPWVLRTGTSVSYANSWTVITQGLVSQVESYTHDDKKPNGSIAFATLAVPPGRLHVFGFNPPSLLCAMSGNAIPLRGECDDIDALTDPKCWEVYYGRVLWICFIWLVGCSSDFASKWEKNFGNKGVLAVAKARKVYSAIGEACKASTARQWALSVYHLKHYLSRTMGRILLTVIPTRLLLNSIHQLHDETLHETVIFDQRSMFSLGSLPLADAKIFANERTIVYIYEDVGVVVKVFGTVAEQAFARELAAYEVCKELQGKVIPWLYGSGRRKSDGRKVLVTSYAGSSVEHLTPELIDQLWMGPLHTLNEKMHHHDIWEGNVVASPQGRLMLIDLGSAVSKDECMDASKCPDQLVYVRFKGSVDTVVRR